VLRRLLLTVSCSLGPLIVDGYSQSMVTVAGGGTDDGRPATAVGLLSPEGVAVDAAGNIYIADFHANRIRKVSALTGVISTVAGNGSQGFSGDGGPAEAAALSGPTDVAVDAAANLYIADFNNHRIRRVAAASGVITSFVGFGGTLGDGGPATAAKLVQPHGVAVDAAGNLYVADSLQYRIRKVIAATGIISTVAGNGTAGFSGDGGAATAASLCGPADVAVDASGNLYIADGPATSYTLRSNNRIRRVDAATGIISTIAGDGTSNYSGDGGPAIAAGLSNSLGVAVDASGNVYIADSDHNRIRKVTGGTISTVAGDGSFGFTGDGGAATAAGLLRPSALALDAAGNMYVALQYQMRIRKIAAASGIISTVAGNGVFGFTGDGGPATAAAFAGLTDVAVDSSGNLTIADSNHNRVRRVAAGSGIVSTIAGDGGVGFSGDGGPATSARLNSPQAIALDSSGDLYIADTFNNRVRKVAADTGDITNVAGKQTPEFSGDGGPATAAGLNAPRGLAFDAEGNLYIADTFNYRIRRVAAGSGIITTVAGNGRNEFSGDGGPATAAGVSAWGMTFDPSGDLYIADSNNSRIRKVAQNGTISTVAGNGSFTLTDGIPATAAGLNQPRDVALDAVGNLYITESRSNRIRKVAAGTGLISTVAGNFVGGSAGGSSGDGGSATSAGMSGPNGIAIDTAGNLYIADSGGNRVRAVFACLQVAPPSLRQPSNESASVSLAPKMEWNATKGTLLYDIYLDTVNPPQSILATDVSSRSYSPANLQPATTYYWKVVAKGDPFCSPPSHALSEVWSFTTTSVCSAPGAFGASVTQ